MEKNRIKELVTLSQSKFLNFFEASYFNRGGKLNKWFLVSRKTERQIRKQFFEGVDDQVDAVLIHAIHEETGKLVLIRQYRVPLNDYIYEMPAGLIDMGESYQTAVARELKEETGLELTEIDESKSSNKAYLSPGMTDESVSLIYCKCKGELSKLYM